MAQRSMNGYGKATCSHLELQPFFPELHFSVSRYSRDRSSAYLVREVSCIFSFQSGISGSICSLRLSMESSRLHRTFSTPSENRSWVYLCPWQDRFSFYCRWSWSFHCLWELTGLCMPDQLQMRQQQSSADISWWGSLRNFPRWTGRKKKNMQHNGCK